MRKLNIAKSAGILIGSAALFTSDSASAQTFTAVGVYDENIVQANAVDTSAVFSSGTGLGNDPTLATTVTLFSTQIADAFALGNGGVTTFDDFNIAVGSNTLSFTTLFAGGTKAVTFTSAAGEHLRTDSTGSLTNRTPISGLVGSTTAGFLNKSNVAPDNLSTNGNFVFTLNEGGLAANEHVTGVGATLLGRNNAGGPYVWTMTVTLDNNDTILLTSSMNFATGNATGDTFFGANAPAGHYITAVSWTGSGFDGIDDLGFVTSNVTAVPEPSTGLMVISGLGILLLGWRRSRKA